jgi:drug/metabolite transporter (DMT)-like permease
MDPFQVLATSAASGLVLLILLVLASRESPVAGVPLLWAAAAGVGTTVGVAALYRGLAIGSAASVAPVAAVVAALLPVLFSALTLGLPGVLRVAGFLVALLGIFLVARAAPQGPGTREGVRLGALAGVGFGAFLVLIAKAGSGGVFVPLAVARTVMLLGAIALLIRRRTPLPGPGASPLALLAGGFDASGTALYLLAQTYVRLDVAAVLSSLYPAATVLLARAITREPVTTMQWIGAAVCLAAVVLIAV